MWLKRVYIFIIVAAIYTAIMVDYPTPTMKALGYNQALQWYAEAVSSRAEVDILYNPGLRKLNAPDTSLNIAALIPGGRDDYPKVLDELLAKRYRAVVECSALDTWHSTPIGQTYLKNMRAHTYRVVVFDGGHHLPTLGLTPDIIIIPQTNGFAAHAHMLDAIKADTLVGLAREAGCPAIIASVPRWGLVKAEQSLVGITARIIDASPPSRPRAQFTPQARNRVSSYGGIIFAYVNQEYIKDQASLNEQIEALGVNGVHKICLAFDYSYIDIASADKLCKLLSQRYQIPVQRVNEPVKVANAILYDGVGLNELPQPGHNSKNQ